MKPSRCIDVVIIPVFILPIIENAINKMIEYMCFRAIIIVLIGRETELFSEININKLSPTSHIVVRWNMTHINVSL